MVVIFLYKCERFLKVYSIYKIDYEIVVDLFRKYTIV